MCFGGGGDQQDPKESKAKLALAQQSAMMINRYGEDFVRLENMYIDDALSAFDENNYLKPMADASNRVQAMYETGRADADAAAFNRGFDPGSGAFKKDSAALASAQARGMGIAAAGAGINQTDQGYGRQQNVVRIGQGLQTEALTGNIDLAQQESDRFMGQAERDFMANSSLQNVAGTALGAAAGYGLQRGIA